MDQPEFTGGVGLKRWRAQVGAVQVHDLHGFSSLVRVVLWQLDSLKDGGARPGNGWPGSQRVRSALD